MKFRFLLVSGFLCGGAVLASGSESPIKVDFGGQGRLRFEQSNRTDYLSRRSAFLLRIRPEVRMSKGAGVLLFLQPQFSKAFGKPEFVGSSVSANSMMSTSGSTYDTSFGVHQAFVEYPLSDSLRFIAGRQLLSYGNEVVLSSLDWDNTGRSFDALKVRYLHRLGTLDLFYAKLFASSVTATSVAAGDSDLLGIYSSNDLGVGFEATDFYLLHRSDGTSGSRLPIVALGARVQSRMGGLDYRAEVTKEFGAALSNPSSAQQLDVEAGWNFSTPFKSRLGIELFYAGAGYDQLYPLAHKYLGIADVFGRRNLQGGVLHLMVAPIVGLTAQMDVHYLLRASTTSAVYKLSGTSALGTGTSASANVGTELDLILTYVVSEDLSATVGGAVLFPGEYLKAEMGDFAPSFWYAQFIAQL